VQHGDGALGLDPVHRLQPRPGIGAEAKQPRHVAENQLYVEDGCRRHLPSSLSLAYAASNTAVSTPTRPSNRLRARLPASCATSGPRTTPRFGEGGGPDARSCVIQALAASVSSRQMSVRKPAASTASRVAAAVIRKLVAGVRAHGTG